MYNQTLKAMLKKVVLSEKRSWYRLLPMVMFAYREVLYLRNPRDSVHSIKKEIHTFLGMTGYYCKYILDYTTIAVPLIKLTKKSMPDKVVWTPEAEPAFSILKNALTFSTVMRNPDPTQTFILQTDTSNVGVGAVLSQGQDDRPIAYFSRKLLDHEKTIQLWK